ncbi:MAG TPA: nitroreductase family protein [Ktedonobacteraceae bacterium]|nr:nitroreductase family protein [Ktedonobacteraceae bacterium]
MPQLNLSSDELLATTRSVRKRLDFSRPVEPELIRECLELAVQAPTGSNMQGWHFVVVTDVQKKKAIGELYRQSYTQYRQQREAGNAAIPSDGPISVATMSKVRDSSQYLADRMHEVPVMVIPCIYGRTDSANSFQQAGVWGSILPAAWNFMLAARARGLGTTWTTLHLKYEREAAQVLGIPYEKIMQAALIPVAYTLGTGFKAAPRIPLEPIVHWEEW